MPQPSDSSRPQRRNIQNTARPLSLGNILSAGLTLYRSHLKSYFGMSLKAHAWGLIPVYGWAKFHTLSAAIARHSFCELINQPETVKQSQEHLAPKLWGFLVIQLLLGVILFAVQVAFNVVSNLLLLPFQFAGVESGAPPDPGSMPLLSAVLISLILFGLFVIFVAAYLWLFARLFVPGVAYAMEEDTDMVKALERSWRLTRGKVAWQIVLMLCIVFVIITPLYILVFIPPLALLIPAISALPANAADSQALWELVVTVLAVVALWVVLSLVLAVVIMPIWQSLKAAIYYDVRVRREGLGLELSDRPDSR